MANDDERVRLAVYMTRKQRRDLHKAAKDLDISASDYVLEPALQRLAADEAARLAPTAAEVRDVHDDR